MTRTRRPRGEPTLLTPATTTMTDTTPDGPDEQLTEAVRERIIANAEFKRTVEAVLETEPPYAGLYEGLLRAIQKDTQKLKAFAIDDRTPVALPPAERPPEWDEIPTMHDESPIHERR